MIKIYTRAILVIILLCSGISFLYAANPSHENIAAQTMNIGDRTEAAVEMPSMGQGNENRGPFDLTAPDQGATSSTCCTKNFGNGKWHTKSHNLFAYGDAIVVTLAAVGLGGELPKNCFGIAEWRHEAAHWTSLAGHLVPLCLFSLNKFELFTESSVFHQVWNYSDILVTACVACAHWQAIEGIDLDCDAGKTLVGIIMITALYNTIKLISHSCARLFSAECFEGTCFYFKIDSPDA